MCYRISLTKENTNFDVLPVALIKNYPLEKRYYKPYTQAKLCFSSDGLSCQLMAFEAIPEKNSQLKLVLCFETDLPFIVDIYSDNRKTAKIGETDVEDEVKFHFFNGEDLQGKYWGANITLDNSTIKKYFNDFVIANNKKISGNIFKLCENGEKVHYGSLYPVDFKSKNPYEQYGEFIITDY
ncbi:MAG: hypothetical protein RR839_06730 [Oscillospiraceae bacterium]